MQTDNTLKYIIYTLLGLVFIIPFIVDSSQLFPFITGKAFTFRVLSASIFFIWLILAIRNAEYRPRFSFILASVTAFVLAIGIANIFGENPFSSFWSNYERMEGYINILHLYVMFLALGSTIKTKEDWNKFLLTSFIISVGIIFKSFEQYSKVSGQEGFRLDSTFGNPIYLAIYNLFNIFFGAYFILGKNFIKENWQKILVGVVVILHLFIMYNTLTRGVMLGLLIGIFIVAALNIFNIKRENNKIWLASLASVIIILISVTAFYFSRDTEFVKSNIVLSRFAEISLTSGTSEARLINWEIATEGFKERPILGWGMGNYNYVFDKYYKPEMYGNETWFDHVHNIVFDWLIAGGAVGLALYLLVLLSLVITIFKSTQYTNIERNIFVGLIAAYFIQNLFVFDNQVSYIYFFIILAIFHSQSGREISIFKNKVDKNISYALSIIIWIMLPVTIYAFNAPAYFASKSSIDTIMSLSGLNKVGQEKISQEIKNIINKIKKTTEYNSFASFEVSTKAVMEPTFNLIRVPENFLAQKEKNDLVNFGLNQMKKELDQNPDDAKVQYIMGIYLNALGDFKNANTFLTKAVELSPNKQVLQISLANNYLRLGEKEKAIEVAKKAYELAEGDSEKNSKYDSLWIEYVKIVSQVDKELLRKLIDDQIKIGNIKRVEMFLQKIVDMNPQNTQAYISLASFNFQNGNKEKSLEVLKTALEKLPKDKEQIQKLISDIEAGKNPADYKY